MLQREVENSGQVEHSAIGGASAGGRVSSCIGALDVRMNGLEVARMEMPEGMIAQHIKQDFPQKQKNPSKRDKPNARRGFQDEKRKEKKRMRAGGKKNEYTLI